MIKLTFSFVKSKIGDKNDFKPVWLKYFGTFEPSLRRLKSAEAQVKKLYAEGKITEQELNEKLEITKRARNHYEQSRKSTRRH